MQEIFFLCDEIFGHTTIALPSVGRRYVSLMQEIM